MAKKIYRIPDMHCSSCVMRLESIEDDLPGILHVAASYHKQLLVVDFDDMVVTEEEILTAIQKKGYQALPSS